MYEQNNVKYKIDLSFITPGIQLVIRLKSKFIILYIIWSIINSVIYFINFEIVTSSINGIFILNLINCMSDNVTEELLHKFKIHWPMITILLKKHLLTQSKIKYQ